MTNTPRHFRIFISSPGDVAKEREIALDLIDNLPYDPAWRERITLEAVAWDKKGAPLLATITPQEAVNKGLPLPSECDIVIVMFWSRMGTPLPFPEYRKEKGEPYLSGTDWEYEDAVKSAKATGYPEVIVYRRTEVPSLLANDPDVTKKLEQYKLVQDFFAAFSEKETGAGLGGYNSYAKVEDFKDLLDTHLKNVLERLLKSPPRPPALKKPETPPPEKTPEWHGSPFPGLRAFNTTDAPIYFGRGRETGELMRRVAERGFVAVVGASGSGKSSLVGAGLIPRLKANGLDGSAEWILPEYKDGQWLGLRFTPGELSDNPFTALAAKCAPYDSTRPNRLAEQLASEPGKLGEMGLKALRGKPDSAKMLVFIDQFEELFTLVDTKYRDPFIAMLQAAAQETRLRVVVTVRSDFYDRCVESIVLSELLRDGTFSLSAPDAFFLKDMIEKPAERAGLSFEEGLAARMVTDTGSDAGALALLAFALDELYKAGATTHAAYEALGKVEGAIGTRAAAIFDGLADEVKAALPAVFTKLVAVNIEGTPTRRRAKLAEFDGGSPAEELVQSLVEARLLVTERETVEVAHEALFRQWPKLVEWINEYKTDLWHIEDIQRAAREWKANGERDSYLLSHDRLEPVYRAQERLGIAFDAVTLAFIRPEAERLVEQFRHAPNHIRQTLIDKDFARLGESGLRELVNALGIYYGTNPFRPSDDAIIASADRVFAQHRQAASPVLIARLDDDNEYVRLAAAEALGRLGASEAVPALIARLDDDNYHVRRAAAEALGRLGASEAVPALIARLDDEDYDVRRAAAAALADLKARVTKQAAWMLLAEDNYLQRAKAVAALGRLGLFPSEGMQQVALRDLLEALDNGDTEAARALGRLGKAEAVPALVKALDDGDAYVGQDAAWALEQIGTKEAKKAAKTWQQRRGKGNAGVASGTLRRP